MNGTSVFNRATCGLGCCGNGCLVRCGQVVLPMKLAAISAMLFVVCGVIGGVIGLVGQALWLPATLESSNAVLRYLGVSAGMALVAGSIAVGPFVTSRRAREIRG